MSWSLVHPRPPARRLARPIGLAVAAIVGLVAPSVAPADGKPGRADPGRVDPRLAGIQAPKGFQVRVVADSPALAGSAAMAFDDSGDLYVAGWRRADRTFETWDSLALPDGGTVRVRRRRKSSADLVRRLRDLDGDGVFEASEIVLDGAEMPSAILPLKNALLLAGSGRLERWTDEDGDGRFETRAVLVDGFAAEGRASLSGLTLGPDGWLYFTAGDADSRAIGSDGSRVDLSRTGGVFRCKPDGSRLKLVAMGFRGLAGGLAFGANFDRFVLDDDPGDGSKFQGVRLIHLAEDGDYGWRLRPGATGPLADFDRSAAEGDRPGKLPALARLGRGIPGGPVVYNGSAFPEALRGTIVYPDALRHAVLGLRIETKGGSDSLQGELPLLSSDDDRFRPVQVVIGADGALYVLDRRGPVDAPAELEAEGGRIYRITWEGDGSTPGLPTKPNDWKRVFAATNEQLVFQLMVSPDLAEADRAQRELVDRGQVARSSCVGYAGNLGAAEHARVLGIQGARQFWNEDVEALMVRLLGDPQPEVRRLAAQAIAWEPRAPIPRLVAKLMPLLDDADGRVVREAALAIGRHAEPSPQNPAATLLRWLYAHPSAAPGVRDAFLRALERMGDAGVEEVALAVRTRPGAERDTAVALFTALRSAAAAEQLPGLVKIPDLTSAERLNLVRMFADVPPEIPVPTQGLAEWVAKHPESDPAVKIAALEACRLAGNPASALVLALLEDDDESVRIAATRIAARTRPPGAVAKLGGRLKDPERSTAEKRAILRALQGSGPSAFAALDAAYLAAEDLALRRDALRSMADADRVKALPALEAALGGRDPAIRADAIRILGEAPAMALRLGKAYQARSMTRDDLPAVLGALRKHDAPEVRKLLATIEDDAARGGTAIDPAEVRARLNQGADPWAGLGVFFRESAARCSACHAVEGKGGTTGPPLTLGDRAPEPDRVIGAILRHPGRKPGSEASRPKDGRASAGPEVDPALALAAVISPEEAPLRPDRAAIELTTAEVADLAAFLLNKPAQDSLRHGPRRLDRVLAIGPFAPGADKLRLPLDRVDPSKPLAGQDGIPTRWTPLEADAAGTLNLRGEFGSKPGRAYLAVRVRSDRDQSAALRIGTEGPARVYLDGKKLAEVAGLEPPATEPAFSQPRPGGLAPLPGLARIPLRSGWNLVIVALDRDGTGDARVALEIASPEPVELQIPKN